MSATDLMFSNALVSALGWTLVHFLWQGCVLAALFWMVCVASRKESAALRYWSGMAGFVLSLVSMVITFLFYYKPEAQFGAGATQSDAVNPFLVLSGQLPETWPLIQLGLEPVLPLVVGLWIVGVLVQSAHTICGWLGIRKLVVSGNSDIGAGLQAATQELISLLGVRSGVLVLKSSLVKVPMAVGWLKPVILLPVGVMASLPRDQLEMIVAHELGHIRRQDYLFNLFQIVMETLLFYHPAMAWMSRRVRQERENCCDDLVVARCGKPATYARALTNLEVMRGPMAVAVLTATGGDLLGRVKRIIDTELPRTRLGFLQVSLLVLGATFISFGAHQGMALSQALNHVAGSVRVQSSDVEWKTRSRSRAVWAEGLGAFSGQPSANNFVQEAPLIEFETEVTGSDGLQSDGLASEGPQRDELSRIATLGFTSVLDQGQGGERNSLKPSSLPAVEPASLLFGGGLAAPVSTLAEASKAYDTSPVVFPAPVSKSTPRYPWKARDQGVEGFVEIAFSVDHRGRVADIEVLDSLPVGVFDKAAIKALKKWKYVKSLPGGDPHRLVQTFNFQLEDAELLVRRDRKCAKTGRRTCSRFPSGATVVYVNPPQESSLPDSVN